MRLITAGSDQKAYIVDHNRRRWVRDVSYLIGTGLRWPDDLEKISKSSLAKIPLGAPVPDPKISKKANTMEFMREYVVSGIAGTGVEFGAAANPMHVPLGVNILYADLFETPQLEDELYVDSGGFEYVPTDINTSFDRMSGIDDNSLDFIVASHVIEHVRDPIGAIKLAASKLKTNGKLVLIVPKKERTLDRNRQLTELDHLILDHKNPSRERDALHVLEFHAIAKPLSLIEVYERSMASIHNDHHSMHYHVWNEKRFTELLIYIQKEYGSINIIENIPALKGEDSYEFYTVLQKN